MIHYATLLPGIERRSIRATMLRATKLPGISMTHCAILLHATLLLGCAQQSCLVYHGLKCTGSRGSPASNPHVQKKLPAGLARVYSSTRSHLRACSVALSRFWTEAATSLTITLASRQSPAVFVEQKLAFMHGAQIDPQTGTRAHTTGTVASIRGYPQANCGNQYTYSWAVL